MPFVRVFLFFSFFLVDSYFGLVLYKSINCEGQGTEYETDQTDISANVGTTFVSVHVNGLLWGFYEQPSWNKGKPGAIEYHYSWSCINFSVILGKLRSFRKLAASQNVESEGLRFFQFIAFAGEATNTPGGNSRSIVLTGSTAWTLFDQSGRSYCLHPETESYYKPRLVTDVHDIVPYDFRISSVKLGCIPSKRTLVYNSNFDDFPEQY